MADIKLYGTLIRDDDTNTQKIVKAAQVEGGYFVCSAKPTSGTWQTGQLCYSTGDSKFYQFNGTNWVEKEFGTTTEATTSAAGLMSAADKTKLNKLDPVLMGNTGCNFVYVDNIDHSVDVGALDHITVCQSGPDGYANISLDKGNITYDADQHTFNGDVFINSVFINDAPTEETAVVRLKELNEAVNNGTLTIQKNGTAVATFTANSSTNQTANIVVPTGAAADKGVDTSISVASTSANLPTSAAVAAFVEGKGYTTTDAVYSGIGVCDVSAAYASKEVILPKFSLINGAKILIRVKNTNTATSGVALNVNNTGKKSITINGSAWSASNQLVSGDYIASYDGTNWNLTRIYLTDTTYSAATTSTDGLMSKTDKSNLDTIVNSFNSDDADATINTVKEVLKAFENAKEGTDIANALASKSEIGHNHETTTTAVLTGVKASGTDTFVKTINGGSGSLTSGDTGAIQYLEDISHTSASLTGDTTFVKSQGVFSAGTLPSLTISAKAPSKITAWSAGTTPVLSATPTYTSDKVSANSDAAITVLTGVKVSQSSSAAPGNHNHSVAISGATSAPGAHTDVVAAAYSNGVLTLSAVNVATGGHTHSYSASVTSGANSGDNFNAAIAVSADGTASVAPNGHTHNYDKTTGITLTRGDAPSLTYSEESVGSASGWSTGSLPSLGTATTGTVSISGGSISKTTKYLTHTHTAASAATTGSAVTSVASNGTVNAVTAIADAEN
jgi:hypothetical protein